MTRMITRIKIRVSTVALLAAISIAPFASTLVANEAIEPVVADAKRSGYVVHRLSMIMIGKRADAKTVSDYIAGKITLAQIASGYKLHPRFEDRLAQYWTQTIGINDPVPFLEFATYDAKTKTFTGKELSSFVNSRTTYYTGGPTPPPYYTIERLGGSTIGAACNRTLYPDPSIELGIFYGIALVANSPYLTDERKSQINLLPQGTDKFIGCGCPHPQVTVTSSPVPVVPWWNPNTKVLACPAILDANLCGPNLKKCWPDTLNQINDWIADSMAMEPGYLAAKTIIEDRPWSEVLTTTQGVGNAALLTFLARPDVSAAFAKLSGGMYPFPNIESNPALPLAQSDPSGLTLLSKTGSAFARYARADHHAGVLTTPAFIRQFNGVRAYSNASRQIFLCREFTVPEGIEQVVSDEPDLAKKPYCSACHTTIEPLSAFWRNWPGVGEMTFYFDPTKPATGEYDGKSGSGVGDLARIYTETSDFQSCVVKRSFEFLIGRQMNTAEMAKFLPPLTQVYRSTGAKVWPVMLGIINSPAFSGQMAEK